MERDRTYHARYLAERSLDWQRVSEYTASFTWLDERGKAVYTAQNEREFNTNEA